MRLEAAAMKLTEKLAWIGRQMRRQDLSST
jgi:hypothetical protein